MIKIWIKIFLKKLEQNKLNTAINLLGLTLGFCALLLTLLYKNYEENYNAWNPIKSQISRVSISSTSNGIWNVGTTGHATYYKKEIPEVEQTLLTGTSYKRRLIKYKRKKQICDRVLYSTKDFFDFFPFKMIEGKAIEFRDHPNHIAVSEHFARSLFGEKTALGKTVTVKDETYTVSTVFKVEQLSHYAPDVLIKYGELELSWGDYMYELFCKYNSNTNLDVLANKMNGVLDNYYYPGLAEQAGLSVPEFKDKYGSMNVLIEPLSSIHLHHKAKKAGLDRTGHYEQLLVLLGLAGLLLIISCINLINLSMANAVTRAKEIGVKQTLGFSKKRIVLEYVLEVFIFCLVAFLLACILGEILLPYFNSYLNISVTLLEPVVLVIMLVLVIVISVIIGWSVGLFIANFETGKVIKGDFTRSKTGGRFSFIILGLQLSISGFFIIGVIIIQNQLQYVMQKDLGYSSEQTVVIPFNDIDDRYKKYEKIKQTLSDNAGISDISASLFIPGKGYTSGTNLSYKDQSFNTANNMIDYNYLDFAQIKLLKGRALDSKFAGDTISNIILNETAAKRLGIYNDPIGKKVKIGWTTNNRNGEMQVVGMIQDFHTDGLDEEIPPMFLMHFQTYKHAEDWIGHVQFKLKTDQIEQIMGDIEQFWKEEIDSEYPFSFRFLDEYYQKTYVEYVKQQKLFSTLTFVVIVICLLGLFALSALIIQQRLKEVAIRKTLGASTKQIITPLISKFIKLGLFSTIIYVPVSYILFQNWLEHFAYRIEMPFWPFLATPLFLVALIYLVVGYKAYVATKVDLITLLKCE
ncbi:MAG: ABC transporter permease [Flavobacteriales bacterium]